jgi:rhamnogalacturonyl hydrolase YesR
MLVACSASTSSKKSYLRLPLMNFSDQRYYAPYPDSSYLDGAYSVLPFCAHLLVLDLPLANSTKAMLDDLWLQFSLLYSHCYDASSSLLVHGYSPSRSPVWANPNTGASPYVWGRALGWYTIGLVETLELMSFSSAIKGSPQYANILGMFISICEAVVKAADVTTGAWWQIMTLPNHTGNYLESSVTSHFTYTLLKGLRLGFLQNTQQINYVDVALKAYHYMDDVFVTHYPNGTLGFGATVGSCGLNSSASYRVCCCFLKKNNVIPGG